jgi:hypothetical protein
MDLLANMLVDIIKETNKLERLPTRNILLKSTKMAEMTSPATHEYIKQF